MAEVDQSLRNPTGAAARVQQRVPVWIREVLLGVGFYGFYTLSRDVQGSAAVSYAHALSNASHIITLERTVGMSHEAAIQHTLLANRWLIELANVLYGSLHMAITLTVLIYLYRRDRSSYRHARNILAVTNTVALVGFIAYPTLPPRLLPSSYGFVDTLAHYPTLWSFDSGSIAKLSNQYAATPSLHLAWALWCALSLAPVLRHRCSRTAVYLYPLATLTVIIVTANHFFLDAFAGAVVLVASTAGLASAARLRRRQHPSAAPGW